MDVNFLDLKLYLLKIFEKMIIKNFSKFMKEKYDNIKHRISLLVTISSHTKSRMN